MILERFLLKDTGIRNAINNGDIISSQPITDNQIQPASLDVRIGRVNVYNHESMTLANEERNNLLKSASNPILIADYDPGDKYAKRYPDQKDIPIIVPPQSFVEIFLHEQLTYDSEKYSLSFELRSSRGRLGIKPDSMFLDSHPAQHIKVWNASPNTYILRGQSKFAQLFIHPQLRSDSQGHWEDDPQIIAKLFPYLNSRRRILSDGRIYFSLGASLLRMRTLEEPIDTAKEMPKNLYETINIQNGYELQPREFVIASLTPIVKCPPCAGIRLLWRNLMSDPMRNVDSHQVSAGWVDPGYENYITCHPIRNGLPQILRTAMPFVTGQVYVYDTAVERTYGSAKLGSHYSGAAGGLVGSKS